MVAKRTALIVDDDAAVLRGFEAAFATAGYDTRVALTFEAARRHASRHALDVAVVDLRLGSDWGIDLVAELRALHARAWIAMVSGYASVAATTDAFQAGANDILFKPIAPSELVKRVERRGAPKRDERGRDKPPTLARAEYEHISRVLADAHGNVSEAARQLGIDRATIQRKLRKVPDE